MHLILKRLIATFWLSMLVILSALFAQADSGKEYKAISDEFLHEAIVNGYDFKTGQAYELLSVDESGQPIIVKIIIDSTTVVTLQIEREE